MHHLATMHAASRPRRTRHRRQGFTLIELLVVIGIVLLLSGFTLAIYNSTINGDRIRSGSRTLQAFLAGARDRAAQAKTFRGLRLIPDPSNNNLVRSCQYIMPMKNEVYPLQSIRLERVDAVDNSTGMAPPDGMADSPDILIVRNMGVGTNWLTLKQNGSFSYPPRIRIPAGTGSWFTFDDTALTGGNLAVRLTSPFQNTTGAVANPAIIAFPHTDGTNSSCELEMANQILENSQPLLLPSGAVIQLSLRGSPFLGSNLPSDWTAHRNNMDIMYSPRGSITGSMAARGPIYLYIADRQDAERDLDPAVSKGEKLIMAIFPQTGNVATFPVDVTDADNNSIADDPFALAKKGAVAGK